MPTIAFWNIDDNVAAEDIRVFAREHDIDILVLAENSTCPFRLLRTLNQHAQRLYYADVGHSDRLTILT